MAKKSGEYEYHQEVADLAEIAGHINHILENKESTFKNRKKLIQLNKHLVERTTELIDKVFNGSIK